MPSLEQLPVELIDLIFGCLCHYCTPRPEPLRAHKELEGTAEKRQKTSTVVALARLCLASKKLSAIATPHLYHRPAEGPWWLLARTLLARPDLASHVRHLFDQSLWREISVFYTRRLSFPDEVLTYMGDSELSRVIRTKPHALTVPGMNLFTWGKSEVFDTVASLCPNLRQAAADINSPTIFTRNAAGSLMSLSHVKVYHISSREMERVGFNLLGCIATAAPRVTTLICENIEQRTETPLTLPTFAHLVWLRLGHAVVGLGALCKLLSACPNLQSFSYGAGGGQSWHPENQEQFTPLQAQHALVRHAPNLTALSLNMVHAPFLGPRRDEDMMRSLSEMSKLEHLDLDLQCLPGFNYQYGREPTDPQDPMLFVHLLPSSIRSLSLYWTDHLRIPLFERLHALLMQLASCTTEKFPRLGHVIVSGLGLELMNRGLQGLEEPKEAFERQGITVHVD